ncbi:E3 ubiquitin-protein ligase TRIM33-like [Macrobrachium nipponense]|uniref:E3 ubiquitin-protein ligase TRIM33-like n=1 Tax=Macrobrachium nipponense TaxID=159736 RepID=UPI0030C89D92
MTGTKLHKKTSTLFGYKYYSSKSSKSPSTSVPHTTQNKKLKHRKNNMFNRLKSYEGPSSYVASSKKDDYSKKGTSSSTPSGTSPVNMSSSKATTTSSSSPSPSSSSSSSPSFKRQTGLTGLLTCPVCLEDYQVDGPAGREPLFLSCHHSLCRACLPKLARSSAGKYNSYSKEGNELSCPECRMVTQIPATGLTQNFYLVSLIETRELKPREPSSRLRMWCNECHGIALETCIAHQVTHLSPVLVNYTTTYSRSKRQLVKYLNKRARHKGEEARDIKEAIEQLDLATTSLKRRLVAQLDYATLAQATASSLLQEIEQICRRVGLDDKLEIPCAGNSDSGVQRKTSSGGLGTEVMSSFLKDNFFQETRSKHFTDSAMKDVDLLMFGNSSNGSSKNAPSPSRSHSADDYLNSPPESSSSRNSPTLDRQVTFDHLNSQEQESKIMVLKESIASLESMHDTLKQEERTNKEKLARIKSHGDNMPKETLSEMFNRALKVLS